MYTPKNRIVTNLYTGTNELVIKGTQEYYKGYYYKTFEGKFFTGKSPNDPPNKELIKVEITSTSYKSETLQSELAYGDFPTIYDDINTPGYSSEMVEKYATLQNIDLNDSIIRYLLPNQYYPIPSAEDYTLGSFTRYFCVKINQPIYLELNQETYNLLKNRDPNYLWQPYKILKLQWTLIGEKQEVFNTNRDVVVLLEKRQKLRGLGRFLKENYLKFYR